MEMNMKTDKHIYDYRLPKGEHVTIFSVVSSADTKNETNLRWFDNIRRIVREICNLCRESRLPLLGRVLNDFDQSWSE